MILQDQSLKPVSKDISLTLRAVEAQTIINTLKKNNYNRLATAQELNIHKSTLFRKIKNLNIKLPEQDGRTKKAKILY